MIMTHDKMQFLFLNTLGVTKVPIKATLTAIDTNKQLTRRRAQRVQHRTFPTTQRYASEFKFITNQCSKVKYYRCLNYYSSSEFIIAAEE